jgi:hypothetical protein
MQMSVKNVEEKVFRDFKAESVREGLNVGKALTLAMKMWLENKHRKPKLSLLKFEPNDWGKGTEMTSEEIDKILY